MIDWLPLLVAVGAAYRLTRLIIKDSFPPLKRGREWILRRWPAEESIFMEEDIISDDPGVLGEGRLRDGGVRVFLARNGEWMAHRAHWLGELVTCPWCAGMYVGAGVSRLIPGMPSLGTIGGWWVWLGMTLFLSATTGLIVKHFDK